MLREIPKTQQREGEPFKKWFHSSSMDLFVWLEDDEEINSFHLTYDKPVNEKAFTWQKEKGASHFKVDDGSRPGKYPETPIFSESVPVPVAALIKALEKEHGDLDSKTTRFIAETIKSHAKQ